MKICLMTSCYALNEQDPHASFLVEGNSHLKARGVEISVFAPSYRGLPSHLIRGVPVHRFRYFPKRWEDLTHMQGAPNRIRNPLYLCIAAFYILFGLVEAVRFCRRQKFDLIHVHWPFPHAIWGYVAGRLSGTPMVITFHGAEVILCKKFFFVKYFLRHAVRNARAVLCNSSFTAGEIAKLGCDKQVHVIPFGTTVAVRSTPRDARRATTRVLFAGRLIRRKGVDYLLRAVPRIAAAVPVHVDIVGIGDQDESLRSLAEELAVTDRVTFHGFVSTEELERRYAEADIFVLPAIVDDRGDTEGLGVVLVEALSFGTPVVASAVGGIPDVIQHERTGLLVPQKDPDALADAIIRLIHDTPLARSLSDRGLEHARDYFDWGRITDQVVDVYQASCSPPPSRGDRGHSTTVPPRAQDTSRVAASEAAPSRQHPAGKLAIRALLSIVMLALLFRQVGWAPLMDRLRHLPPAFIVFAWVFYAACQGISAFRWQLFLTAKGVHVPLGRLFNIYMVGMFVNHFMPGSVGGDVVKGYQLYRVTRDSRISAVSIVLERFTGLLGLSAISVVTLVIGYQRLNSPLILGAVVGTAVLLVGIAGLIWYLPTAPVAMWIVDRVVPHRVARTLREFGGALVSYRSHPRTLLGALSISSLLHLLCAAYYALASRVMGIPVDFAYFVMFLPLVSLITMIPISVGGLGLREGTMVILFGAVGVSSADILSLTLTVYLLNSLLSLWGGWLLLWGMLAAPAAPITIARPVRAGRSRNRPVPS